VTLTGTGFESGLTVTIGGVDATNVSVVSSTLITAKTGSHARGLVSVIVRNSSGAASTLVNQYRYGLFDTNSDFLVTDADLINLTDFLFLGAPAPSDTGDANGDGRVDAVDVAYLINFLRAGGPEPQ
jgi:hypothetical protein